MPMPEADSEQEVYYEDLINPPTKHDESTASLQTELKSTVAAGGSDKVSARQGNAGSNPLKRQRTLVDMFGSTSTKKTKVEGSSSVVVSKSQTLNSIPFKLNDFINSLTQEQRDLLGLEIETMGKSW